MINPEKIKQTLLSEIEKMNQDREDFCKRPGIDFTRDRKITFDCSPFPDFHRKWIRQP